MGGDLDLQNAMTTDQAKALLPSERPTTFARMCAAAREEANRIESEQIARMMGGFITAPMPERMRLRDDFVGLMKLVDRIIADDDVMNRLRTYK